MTSYLKRQIIKALNVVIDSYSIGDILIFHEQSKRKETHTNPLAKYGMKCFSQTDEDGIIIEIIKRLGIKNGNFIEFGVGNGMENNTLFLLTLGWMGNWYGGENLAFDTKKSKKLSFEKVWITKENIVELCEKSTSNNIDLISMDLDGNDYHLIKEILERNINPSIFIVEYNAKFIPPSEFIMRYDENHTWDGDNFGASLMSFNNLFKQHNYSLVCCNSATGANAFYIKSEFMKLFSDVPNDISKIYSPPYYIIERKYGHEQSINTIENIING